MEKLKLMIVDDEERFLTTTEKLLKKMGVDVVTASSGGEALEKLRAHTVHVVILDVKMPGMDGVATLKQIKRQFPMIEVIMLTGHGTLESAVEGLKTGAVDYLTKPADLDQILEKANDAFSRRKSIEERIRVARMRGLMKSPREILKNT